jgi:hypothetical protein
MWSVKAAALIQGFWMAEVDNELFLQFKHSREWVAFSTANMWIETRALGLVAKWGHLYTPLESSRKWPGNFTPQLHEFTCICPVNRRDRTSATQIACPGRT